MADENKALDIATEALSMTRVNSEMVKTVADNLARHQDECGERSKQVLNKLDLMQRMQNEQIGKVYNHFNGIVYRIGAIIIMLLISIVGFLIVKSFMFKDDVKYISIPVPEIEKKIQK